MPDSPHTATQAATMTEQVARAIREEQVRLLRDDEKAKCPDNRFYEEHVAPYALAGAAIAALQGSAALPSEAMEICDWCEGSGQGVADTVCDKCNGSGGTPTAPVQDDDARLIARMCEIADRDDTTGLAADALREGSERLASRLNQATKGDGL